MSHYFNQQEAKERYVKKNCKHLFFKKKICTCYCGVIYMNIALSNAKKIHLTFYLRQNTMTKRNSGSFSLCEFVACLACKNARFCLLVYGPQKLTKPPLLKVKDIIFMMLPSSLHSLTIIL